MLVKFLPTYTGGGLGSVNYLLNERKEQGTSRILKGNEAQTRAIIDQITYKQKTCFGVLSFTEQANSIKDKIKQEIIEDFERTLLGDYMKDRVNILWVEHSDKDGRLELNFLIPKIDLVTGKSFNPYFAQADQFNIDLWKRTINDEYGFTSPDNPQREQNIRIDKKDLAHYNQVAELDKALKELIAQGAIKNRTHMLEILEQNGYKITRKNEKGISITLPNQKRPNRLKGGIYSAEFTDIDRLSELGETQSRAIQQYANRDTQAECERNRSRINENIRRRDERNKKRYERNTKQFRKAIRRNIQQNGRYQRRDISRNEANDITKNIKWRNADSPNDRHISRVFYQLSNLQQSNDRYGETITKQQSDERSARKMANTNGYAIQLSKRNDQERTENSNIRPETSVKDEGRAIIYQIKQSGDIDDSTRNRIIQRNREITERNFEITRRNNAKAEREREIIKRLRTVAEQENNAILQGLSREFQEQTRKYFIIIQERIRKRREQIRKLRARAERDRADQSRIKRTFTDIFRSGLSKISERLRGIKNGLQGITSRLRSLKSETRSKIDGNTDSISRSIQQSISRVDKQYETEFRERLDKETKRAITNCGYEIERELKKPERQRIVERKRERERHIMRPRF